MTKWLVRVCMWVRGGGGGGGERLSYDRERESIR